MKTIKIQGTNDYYISDLGYVIKLKENGEIKLPKLIRRRDGYISVKIKYGNTWTTKLVHILIRENFMNNFDKNLQINHINEDKTDNRLENLELVTASENTKKKSNHNLNFQSKKILVVNCKDNLDFKICKTISDSAKWVGGRQNGVSQALDGRILKTYKGYIYKTL